MKIFRNLGIGACVLVVASVVPWGARADEVQPPNVVLFFTDDQGWRDLGCYGSPDLRTPRIDRLAAEGARFTSFYAAAPMCSPSRAALLTGRVPQRAGVPRNVGSRLGDRGLPPEQVTLAERLQDQDYATALIGKWHLGSAPGSAPNDQGFDRFFGFLGGCVDNYSHTYYWGEPHFHDLWRDDQEVYEDGIYLNDLLTREALRFIDEHRQRPFFLYVSYNLPHYPMQAPQYLVRQFEALEEPRRTYAAMMAAVDESVGAVLDRLDRHGLADRTLVLFLSDHGATAELRGNGLAGDNGPFRGTKFSLFDGGLRVPCLVRWPGRVPAGVVRDQMAGAIDLTPTILSAVGVVVDDEPGAFDGQDLMGVLMRDEPTPHEALFWTSGDQQAVRMGRWKLVRNGLGEDRQPLTGADAVFLSDLERDPSESTNRAAEHPEQVEALGRALDEWLASLAEDG